MTEMAIQAEDVSKRYAKTVAVDRLDLRVPVGCVCGLVGPNGAGKTTTMAMLLGMVPPTTGRLEVMGLNPTTRSYQLRQRVGYVPERHCIYPWMKVPQALSFARQLYPTWNKAEAERLVNWLELPLKRRVKELSRGELAKLALTIALAHEPELLLLDEPTSGLDPIVRRNFLDTIRQLINQRRCTVLFSTHILSDVERIADHVLVMNHGRLIADETLDTLRHRFVKASFLFAHAMDGTEIAIPHAIRIDKAMREWVVLFPALPEEQVRTIARVAGATDCYIQPVSLDDAFVELVGPSATQEKEFEGARR